jgi:hypothetical protein
MAGVRLRRLCGRVEAVRERRVSHRRGSRRQWSSHHQRVVESFLRIVPLSTTAYRRNDPRRLTHDGTFVAGNIEEGGKDLVLASYGAGLRVHNRTATVGRLDIGHSTEGWRVVFKINDPFKRSTLSGGRTEVIPFVP